MTHDEYIDVMRLVETAIRASGRYAFFRSKAGKAAPEVDQAKALLRETLEELEKFNPDVTLHTQRTQP